MFVGTLVLSCGRLVGLGCVRVEIMFGCVPSVVFCLVRFC